MTFYNNNEDIIIKDYKKLNDCYIIKYMNNSTETKIGISQKEIETLMYNQAINRDKDLYDKIKSSTRKQFLVYIASFLPIVIGIKIKFSLLFYIAFIYSIYSLYNLNKENKKLNELKKYRIYISLKQELDKDQNKNITKILDIDPYYRKELSINTLDNLSYREIKQIKKELNRRKNFNK